VAGIGIRDGICEKRHQLHRFMNTAAHETSCQIPPDIPLRKGGEGFPAIRNQAPAVIGMRRSGKSTFLQ
jgi:hypothetical protein